MTFKSCFDLDSQLPLLLAQPLHLAALLESQFLPVTQAINKAKV
jgi:hypothetical protein